MPIIAANERATIDPPETLFFAVAVDTGSSLLESSGGREATFPRRWNEEQFEAADGFEVE